MRWAPLHESALAGLEHAYMQWQAASKNFEHAKAAGDRVPEKKFAEMAKKAEDAEEAHKSAQQVLHDAEFEEGREFRLARAAELFREGGSFGTPRAHDEL